MLVLQRGQAFQHLFEFVLGRAPIAVAREIALHALQLDLGAASSTLVSQLHFVVADDAFDQLVAGSHPIMGTLQRRRFLGSDLWIASAGTCHSHYCRSMVWAEPEHLAAPVLRDQDRAPMDSPILEG